MTNAPPTFWNHHFKKNLLLFTLSQHLTARSFPSANAGDPVVQDYACPLSGLCEVKVLRIACGGPFFPDGIAIAAYKSVIRKCEACAKS